MRKKIHWNVPYIICADIYEGDTDCDRILLDLDRAKIEYKDKRVGMMHQLQILATVKTAGKIFNIITKDDK